MNFSGVVFDDFNKINFTNVSINNLDIENIENHINNIYKNDKNYKTEKEKLNDKHEIENLDLEYKIKYANNFRESFRIVKHFLAEIDNNLEASNFHIFELYTKELETKYKLEVSSEEKNLKNESNKSKMSTLLDRIMLSIYRTTSDHHTNLLTILNFTIMMIACFGIIYFFKDLTVDYFNFISFDYCRKSTLPCIAVFMMKYIILIFIGYLTFTKHNWIILLISLFFILLYFFNRNVFQTIIILLFFVLLFVAIDNYKKIKYFIFSVSMLSMYLTFFYILATNPSMIIPIFNSNQNLENKFLQTEIVKIKNDELHNISKQINSEINPKSIIMSNDFILKNKDILYNNLKNNDNLKTQTPYKEIYTAIYKDKLNKNISNSINFIYMIVLGLCLFSLQKTARRNSVVPI